MSSSGPFAQVAGDIRVSMPSEKNARLEHIAAATHSSVPDPVVAVGKIPIATRTNYFEVKIVSKGHGPMVVAVGLGPADYPLVGRMPGWEPKSCALHADDGKVFDASGSALRQVMNVCKVGDRIGCGATVDDNGRVTNIFFTKNRRQVVEFNAQDLKAGVYGSTAASTLYPLVGLASPGIVVEATLAACAKHTHASTSQLAAEAKADDGGDGTGISVGQWLRVKPSVAEPKYDWGTHVNHASVGLLVKKISAAKWIVRFPDALTWRAAPDEMEVAPIPDIPIGAAVRVKAIVDAPAYTWGPGEVKKYPGCVGRLRKKKGDSCWLVDFVEQPIHYWLAHPHELEVVDVPDLEVGDVVRVKPSVCKPTFGWGEISHLCSGTVHKKRDDGTWLIDFPEQPVTYWKCDAKDVEVVPESQRDGAADARKYQHAAHADHDLVKVPMSEGAPAWICDVCGKASAKAVGRFHCAEDCDWDACYGCMVKIGCLVRVPASVTKPACGWGEVTHADIGVVERVSKVDGKHFIVNFPSDSTWVATPRDLEVVRAPDIHRGTWVRVKPGIAEPRYKWGSVTPGSVGRLHEKRSSDCWRVDFPEQADTYWSAFPPELEVAPLPTLEVGATVKVKKGIQKPRYGFGRGVDHSSVGVLAAKKSDAEWTVDFPGRKGWAADPFELEATSEEAKDADGDGDVSAASSTFDSGDDSNDDPVVDPDADDDVEDVVVDVSGRKVALRIIDGAVLGDLELLSEEGAFGAVYRGSHCGTAVAVKLLKGVDAGSVPAPTMEDFKKEAALLQRVQSPRVVQMMCLARFDGGRGIGIVTEMAELGSLSHLIATKLALPEGSAERRAMLPLATKHKIARDILAGVAHLHDAHRPPVLHLDLKPSNVLVVDGYRAKITDFGLARFKAAAIGVKSSTGGRAKGGTIVYADPLQLLGKTAVPAMDIYSAALTLFDLYEEEHPYADVALLMTLPELYLTAVASGTVRPTLTDKTPPRVAELLAKMWHPRMDARPSAQDAIKEIDAIIAAEPAAGAGAGH